MSPEHLPVNRRPSRGLPCPNCHVDMQPHHIPTVSVDRCPQCGALWFGVGEYVKYRKFVDLALERRRGARVRFVAEPCEQPRRCPACGDDTLEPGIVDDGWAGWRCARCGGFVFDGAIVEAMREAAETSYRNGTPTTTRERVLLILARLLRWFV